MTLFYYFARRGASAVASTTVPVNTTPPSISGTAGVGNVLTFANGTWTGSPTPTLTGELYRNGAATGVTSGTYTQTSEDAGATLLWRVKALNSAAPSGVFADSAGVNVPLPFTSDANTYWWNFTSTANILTNTAGVETVAYARERVGNKTPLVQTMKDRQPLKITDGANCNQATPRRLEVESTAGLANGTTGWYFATNFKPATANSVLMAIGRASTSLVPSRGLIDFTSSRNIRVQACDADGSTIASLGITPAQTLNVAMTLEVLFTTGAPATAQVWINGVLQTLTGGTAPNIGAFPASDPFIMTLLNGITATNALTGSDGSTQQAIFYNGVISGAARTSISSYMNSVRQA
jgi:hypothetical protein